MIVISMMNDFVLIPGGGFQVLMFPFFFDDMSLCTEFEKFIESIDNIHELAFAENQEFPV